MKSIGAKIALGYFVVIFINVAIAIFTIYYLNRLSSPVDQVLEEKLNNVNASRSMIQSLVQQEFEIFFEKPLPITPQIRS